MFATQFATQFATDFSGVLFFQSVLAEVVPILAPDPGDAPPYSPQIHPAFLIAVVVFSSAAMLFILSSNVRGLISKKQLVVRSALLMLFTWGGVLAWLFVAPPNDEYQAWQEAHRKWKNKEVVGELVDGQDSRELLAPDDQIVDPDPLPST